MYFPLWVSQSRRSPGLLLCVRCSQQTNAPCRFLSSLLIAITSIQEAKYNFRTFNEVSDGGRDGDCAFVTGMDTTHGVTTFARIGSVGGHPSINVAQREL